MSVGQVTSLAPIQALDAYTAPYGHKIVRKMFLAKGYVSSERHFDFIAERIFDVIQQFWGQIESGLYCQMISSSLYQRVSIHVPPEDPMIAGFRRSLWVKSIIKECYFDSDRTLDISLDWRIRNVISDFFRPRILSSKMNRNIERFKSHLSNQICKDFAIMETRFFSCVSEFERCLHRHLREGKNVEIIDVATSIWSSFLNVLTGTATCSGSERSRLYESAKNETIERGENRKRFFEYTAFHRVSYSLYCPDIRGQYQLAVECRKGKLKYHLDYCTDCFDFTSENNIDYMANNTFISNEFINSSFTLRKEKHIWARWFGSSIRQAFESKVEHVIPAPFYLPFTPMPSTFMNSLLYSLFSENPPFDEIALFCRESHLTDQKVVKESEHGKKLHQLPVGLFSATDSGRPTVPFAAATFSVIPEAKPLSSFIASSTFGLTSATDSGRPTAPFAAATFSVIPEAKPLSSFIASSTFGLTRSVAEAKPMTHLHSKKVTKERTNIGQNVYDYVFYRKPLGDLVITTSNAVDYLHAVKMVEVSFLNRRHFLGNRSTYPIRQRILKVSRELSTSQVFTNSLLPQKFTSLEYLMQPENWVDTRVAFQAKLLMDYNVRSKSLSERLEPVVVAIRGNTGVGKSAWVMRHIGESLGNNKQLVGGVLSPDNIKATLKRTSSKILLNRQVYAEGRVVFERYLKMLTHQTSIRGVVIDTRLLNLDEFEQMLAFAIERGVQLKLIDIDAPIWFSVVSVLNRDPTGSDPCVTFDVIKDGFIRSRLNRRQFFEYICDSNSGNISYFLNQISLNGKPSKIAEFTDQCWMQHCSNNDTFDGCFEIVDEEEIDSIARTTITKERIDQLDMTQAQKDVLMKWKDYTVEGALARHSKIKGPKPIKKECLQA